MGSVKPRWADFTRSSVSGGPVRASLGHVSPNLSTNDALAAEIDGEREAQRIKPGMLAELSGIPYRTLARYLNGEREITVTVLDKLAEALEVPGEELLSRAKARQGRGRRVVAEPVPAVRDRPWRTRLAEEFRRAHVRSPHLGLGDILPRRAALAQRALDGDPTVDEATLRLVAQALGLDPGVVQGYKGADEQMVARGASSAGAS